jgi:Flp pilus assembly pilin Flp
LLLVILQVNRMLGLIEQNPAAARSFCRHLHAHISAGSVSKLIVMLIKLVQLAITNADTAATAASASGSTKSAKRSKPKSKKGSKTAVQAKGRGTKRSKAPVSDDSSSESDSDADTAAITAAAATADSDDDVVIMTATDAVLMDNLLSLVATLWESIAHTLQRPDQLHCVELLEQHITSDTLAALLAAFRTAPAPRAAVLRIAGIVGSDVVPTQLLEELVSELLALPGTASVSAYGPVVGLLCAWGEQGHLVAAIVDSLDSAFNGSSATASATAASDDTAGDELELEHDSDAENVHAQVRSKGKGKAEKGSSKTKAAARATAVLPAAAATVLPPRLALSMLSYLLSAGAVSEATTATAAAASSASEKASAAAMTAARDALVSDARAMRRLTSALQGAHKLANARLIHTSNNNNNSTEMLSDELVLLGVLALSKVLLHSEAAAAVTDSEDSDDDDSGASRSTTAISSVTDMLQWVSDTVLPALTDSSSTSSSSSSEQSSSFAHAVTTVALSLAAECVALTWRLSDVSTYVSAWAAALLATLPPVHATAAAVKAGTADDDSSDSDDSDGEEQTNSTTATAAAVAAKSTVKQLLPALCRLQYKLIAAEGDGASPCAELWTLLLRFADTGVQTHSDAAMCEDSDEDSTAISASSGGLLVVQGAPVACVQKLISQTLFTYSRREEAGASLVEHTLLPAVCAAVSVQHVQQPKSKGKSNKRKAVAAAVEAAAAAAAATPAAVTLADLRRLRLGATELVLPRYASAVVLALLKSAGGARALLTAALHYKQQRTSSSDSVSKESAALCCVHLLQAVVQHAPAKVSAAAAVEVHTELSKRAIVRREAAQRRRALMRTSTDSNSSSVVDSESEDSVTLTDRSTVVQRLAAAEQCLFDQLEASRQAAIAVKPAASTTVKASTAK